MTHEIVDVLTEEIVGLRARLNLIHDHLHHERFNEAHAVCHCDNVEDLGKPLPGSNISQADGATLELFAHDFNTMARQVDLMACWVAFIPSAARAGFVSIQIGGNVNAIQQLRLMLGMPETKAIGDHPNKESSHDR